MIFVISGALITENDGRKFSYKKKCDSCGQVQSGTNRQPVPGGTGQANRGSFNCSKCGTTNKVIIGYTKDSAQRTAIAGGGSLTAEQQAAVASGRFLVSLIRGVIKLAWRLFKIVILLVLLAVILLLLNSKLHFIPDVDLAAASKQLTTVLK